MPEKYKAGIACIDRKQWFTDHLAAAASLEQQIKDLRPANSTLLSAHVVSLRGADRWVCIFRKETQQGEPEP